MTDKNQKAILAHSPILSDSGDLPCLDIFLVYARKHPGEDVQGLAFATNGTWTVLGFDKGSSVKAPKLSVAPIDGREFDPTKIFELRLWVPVKLHDEPAEGDVLAHEYRCMRGESCSLRPPSREQLVDYDRVSVLIFFLDELDCRHVVSGGVLFALFCLTSAGIGGRLFFASRSRLMLQITHLVEPPADRY